MEIKRKNVNRKRISGKVFFFRHRQKNFKTATTPPFYMLIDSISTIIFIIIPLLGIQKIP